MALENESRNYFKIGKIVGSNSSNSSFTVYIESYKDKETRYNPTEFDSKKTSTIGIILDEVDIKSFVSKIYDKIKLQEPYNEMTDELE